MPYKIVVALNKNLDVGVALNAAAHVALGLAGKGCAMSGAIEAFDFRDYADADGGSHDHISALSLIVLRGRNGELRSLRTEARSVGLLTVDFTNQMTSDTYIEQLERSAATPEADLEYYAVAIFGNSSEVDPLTRKLSLWR